MANMTVLAIMIAILIVLTLIISTEKSYVKRNIMRIGNWVINFFRF